MRHALGLMITGAVIPAAGADGLVGAEAPAAIKTSGYLTAIPGRLTHYERCFIRFGAT
jgi:hypothetical protein